MTAATVGPIAPLGRHSSPLRTFVARATAIAALGASRPRVNVSRSSSRARRGMRDDDARAGASNLGTTASETVRPTTRTAPSPTTAATATTA